MFPSVRFVIVQRVFECRDLAGQVHGPAQPITPHMLPWSKAPKSKAKAPRHVGSRLLLEDCCGGGEHLLWQLTHTWALLNLLGRCGANIQSAQFASSWEHSTGRRQYSQRVKEPLHVICSGTVGQPWTAQVSCFQLNSTFLSLWFVLLWLCVVLSGTWNFCVTSIGDLEPFAWWCSVSATHTTLSVYLHWLVGNLLVHFFKAVFGHGVTQCI